MHPGVFHVANEPPQRALPQPPRRPLLRRSTLTNPLSHTCLEVDIDLAPAASELLRQNGHFATGLGWGHRRQRQISISTPRIDGTLNQ